MSKLSIFVDESGTFDINSKHNPFYIYSLVFHDQKDDINHDIKVLNQHLDYKRFNQHTIHSNELIRREKGYKYFSIDDRKVLFNQIYYFTLSVPIKFQSFMYVKRLYREKFELQSFMAKELGRFIKDNLEYFCSFDQITVYYDNGQYEITELLNNVLNASLDNISFKKVSPNDYRLFQSADLICTLELLRMKLEHKVKSESERHFFKKGELKRTYLKGIARKRF